jgi:hypothetical protein
MKVIFFAKQDEGEYISEHARVVVKTLLGSLKEYVG